MSSGNRILAGTKRVGTERENPRDMKKKLNGCPNRHKEGEIGVAVAKRGSRWEEEEEEYSVIGVLKRRSPSAAYH